MLKKTQKDIEHLNLNEGDSFTFLSFNPYTSLKIDTDSLQTRVAKFASKA